MTGRIEKATTVQEAQWACELTPLQEGDERWVDFKEIRGTDVQERFKRLLIKPPSAKDNFSHITFAGHRGCGKSTELLQVSEALRENGFLVVYCQANEELDISDIEYSDLLLAASKVLVQDVGERFSLDETFNSVTQRSILFYRYALEYNGDRWVDVHPLIYDLPELQREVRSLVGAKKTRTKRARG